MTASSWFRLASVLCVMIGTRVSLGQEAEYHARRDASQGARQASLETTAVRDARDRAASLAELRKRYKETKRQTLILFSSC
jgi:hypothetical protein